MTLIDQSWNLREWHDFLLEEFDLIIGRDWHWAWHENIWAIEFVDARMETAVRLKAKPQ